MPKIVLSAAQDGHKVGDTVEVDDQRARFLVEAGAALYTTVADARAARTNPEETAATKR